MLERDKPNTIPWEVLTDLGELRMGLVGLDGETVIKPTVWLTYGYVADGVDPEAGSDPQPPTPSWEQQMVEQATQANQAAQAAQKAAEEAAESVASAGPYADEAKKSAEAAKASQEAAATSAQQASQAAKSAQDAAGSIGDAVQRAEQAATVAGLAQRAAETAQTAAAQSAGTAQGAATTASQAAQTAQGAATQAGEYLATVEADAQAAATAAAEAGESQEAAQTAAQEAGNARDQASTAATTAQGHATAASTAKDAAEQAAGNAADAQAGAAQAAQEAAGSASDAQTAKEAAEAAAAIIPRMSAEVAGKFLGANKAGTALEFLDAPSGGAGGELLLAEYVHQGNQEIRFSSFDWETGIGECMEPHGLTEPERVLIAFDNLGENNQAYKKLMVIPYEWAYENGAIYAVPNGETSVIITKSDKVSPIVVNPDHAANALIDLSAFHLEVPVTLSINNLGLEFETGDTISILISGCFSTFGTSTQMTGMPSNIIFAFSNLYATNGRAYNGTIGIIQTNAIVDKTHGTCVSKQSIHGYARGNTSSGINYIADNGIITSNTNALNISSGRIDRISSLYAFVSNGTIIRLTMFKGAKNNGLAN